MDKKKYWQKNQCIKSLNTIPADNASLQEWKNWALEVREIAFAAIENFKPQRYKIKTLKKKIKEREIACYDYNSLFKYYSEKEDTEKDNFCESIAILIKNLLFKVSALIKNKK